VDNKKIIVISILMIVMVLTVTVFGSAFLVKTKNNSPLTDPSFFKSMGDEYAKQNNDIKAIIAYKKSLSMQENPVVKNNLAVLYYKNQQYDLAIEQLEELIIIDSQNPSTHYDLAINLVDKFRNKENKQLEDLYLALSEFEKAEMLEAGYSYAQENIIVLREILKI
jgi:tetratricopeptide (TPR) repeat protein